MIKEKKPWIWEKIESREVYYEIKRKEGKKI